MSKAILCDICEKPITTEQSLLFNHHLYRQYKVTIKSIEMGESFAGFFKKSQCLDVCPICMNKFVEFVKGSEENE